MKNILLYILLGSLVSAYLIEESYSFVQGGNYQSDIITSHPESKTSAEYFLCGVGLRSMIWQRFQYICNCSQTNFGHRCQWCTNTHNTKTNALKAVFCNVADWNKQIQRVTETGNTNIGNWTHLKCSDGQYISAISINTAYDQDEYLGFNSLRIKCQNKSLNQNTILETSKTANFSVFSKATKGSFISSIKIQSIKDGMQTGAIFNFEKMRNLQKPIIWAMRTDLMKFKYSSSFDQWHVVYKINNLTGTSSWCPKTPYKDQWAQGCADKKYQIIGILIQGRGIPNLSQWVTRYRLSYSLNQEQYFSYQNKQFIANFDRSTIVQNIFDRPIIAKCVRIYPTSYFDTIAMRFDILVQQI